MAPARVRRVSSFSGVDMAKNKGSEEYSPRVLKLALKDGNAAVRRQAVIAIAEAGDRDALILLAPALKDPSSLVRAQTVVLLRTFEDPLATRLLVWVLENDAHPFIRGKAAWALGERGDPSVIKFLAPALEEHDNYVSRSAAAALKKLGGPDVATRPAEADLPEVESEAKPKAKATPKPKSAPKTKQKPRTSPQVTTTGKRGKRRN